MPFTLLRLVCLAGLLAAVVSSPAGAAERQPARASAPAEDPAAARVIVGYKADAPILRAHPVLGRETLKSVANIYQQRADLLGQRAGVPLATGRALSDRVHVVTARGLGSSTLAARLAQDPDVAYAVPDRRRRALMVPNDPLYAAGPASGRGPDVGQWYLRAPTDLFKSAVNAEAAWDVTTGSADIVVAVLDTGVLFDHLDLQGRLLTGYDFVTDSRYGNDGSGRDVNAADPGDWITSAEDASGTFRGCGAGDSSWHGTHVAGILGALTNNAIGMAGIAHGARILPVRVLGKCGGFDSDIAAGMRWAAGIDQPGLPGSSTPARVLNLSLGGDGACTEPYISAVNDVVARGAVVVAAAGNSVGRVVGTPANCPGALGVAGLRHAGSKVGFSDLGPEIAIAAPGGNCINIDAGEPCLYPILTASNSGLRGPNAGGSIFTDSFNFSVGTSFATPIVAGTVALMLSARPQLTPAEVKKALQSSARAFPSSGADNGPDDPTPVTQCVAPGNSDQLQCYCTTGLCGAGMLDAAAALAAVTTGLFARIDATPAAPVVGTAVQLSGAGTLVGAGRSVATYQWTLVSGGGVVTGFNGATNAASATLQPVAAGTVVVRLTVTDDLGAQATAERSIAVAEAPAVEPPPDAGGGGGGGAMSAGWIVLLALAGATLAHGGRLAAWAFCCAMLLGATLSFAAPAAAGAADSIGDQPVRGLIVRLKNAPPHERLSLRIGANAREQAQAVAESEGEAVRWRRVIGDTRLDTTPATPGRHVGALRPVGRDQQVLAFDKPMSRADAQAAIARLRAHADVDWVDVNSRERRLQVPDDPWFANGSQWWLQAPAGTNANAMADRRRGAPGLLTAWLQPGGTGSGTLAGAVAVLDTGITAHPDLAGRTLPGYDFVTDLKFGNDGDGRDADPSDPGDFVSFADLTDPHFSGCGVANSSWHGTVISGIAGAATNNADGVAGVNWNARVLPVRVAGKCGADVADIVDGMRWAAGLAVAGVPLNPNPVRIVNISFGGSAACGAAYQTAIDELKAIGVVVVAAAGNEHAAPTRPASCIGAVGVVGLNRDGFKTHYSNFGSELAASGIATVAGDDVGQGAQWNSLADPGILSIGNSGTQGPAAAGYYYYWGTSFATPVVAGVASLMLSVNPALSYDQIVEGLRKSARPHVTGPKIGNCSWDNPGRCACTAATCGAGILDAEQALLYAANPTTYVAPARTGEVIDNPEVTAAAALGPDRSPNSPLPPPPPPPVVDNGGGGGVSSVGWILALAVSTLILLLVRRRRDGT